MKLTLVCFYQTVLCLGIKNDGCRFEIHPNHQCPSSLNEWGLRVINYCIIKEHYHCLVTEHNRVVHCCIPPITIEKGHMPRYNVRHNVIDETPCEDEYFMPWHNLSNTLRDNGPEHCMFKKAKCADFEGTLTCSNGTATEDSRCYCDYQQGYVPKFFLPGGLLCFNSAENTCIRTFTCNGANEKMNYHRALPTLCVTAEAVEYQNVLRLKTTHDAAATTEEKPIGWQQWIIMTIIIVVCLVLSQVCRYFIQARVSKTRHANINISPSFTRTIGNDRRDVEHSNTNEPGLRPEEFPTFSAHEYQEIYSLPQVQGLFNDDHRSVARSSISLSITAFEEFIRDSDVGYLEPCQINLEPYQAVPADCLKAAATKNAEIPQETSVKQTSSCRMNMTDSSPSSSV